MLNYGGSITSAFPTTFCHSPASLTCQLCNSVIKETGSGSFSFVYSTTSGQPFQIPNRSEKCIHCGINICEKCLNDNQEVINLHNDSNDPNKSMTPNQLSQAQFHYNVVKKEFKQMYNYSKEIVEKLHLLNNAIKVEESAVSELNSIKHLVNTKALELIKQINQEKLELVEQIENAKLKYESTLNDRKEYYALSMQYKDELRKVIRKYKECKTDEQCSLSEMLKMYMSVKSITKNLDDYDHIKLITEQDPLQVKFEERPTYRNLIGKLLLNKEPIEIINLDEQIKNSTENLSKEIMQVLSSQLKSASQNKIIDSTLKKQIIPTLYSNNKSNSSKSKSKSKLNKSIENLNTPTVNPLKSSRKDASRSVSLNDLLNVDENEPIDASFQTNNLNPINMIKCGSDAIKNKRFSIINNNCNNNSNNKTLSSRELISKSTNNLMSSSSSSNTNQDKKKSLVKSTQFNLPFKGQPPLPSTELSVTQQNSLLIRKLPYIPYTNFTAQKPFLQSILKNSESVQPTTVNHLTDLINKRMDHYKLKKTPKERLEIDILPSYLSFSQNKLLIASTHGRIRVIDLFSYKIQKDELKNILINGICIPKTTCLNINADNNQTDMFYTVANAEITNSCDDPLNVSNSVVIVTKNELRVLRKKDPNDNDNYLFSNPSGICYDDYGNLYICDTGNNRVKVLDQNLLLKCVIESASSKDDPLMQPISVACYQNILFLCDSGKHRIVSYYILYNGDEFKFKSLIGYGFGSELGMFRYPSDVGTDDLGLVSVRDSQNSRVQLFGIDSRPFHMIDLNSDNKEIIHSMTVASNGDIYVAKMVNLQENDQNGQTQTNTKYYIDIY